MGVRLADYLLTLSVWPSPSSMVTLVRARRSSIVTEVNASLPPMAWRVEVLPYRSNAYGTSMDLCSLCHVIRRSKSLKYRNWFWIRELSSSIGNKDDRQWR